MFGAPQDVDAVDSTSTSAVATTPRIAAGGGHAYVVWQRLADGLFAYQDVANGGTTLTIPIDPTENLAMAAVDGSGALVGVGHVHGGEEVGMRRALLGLASCCGDGSIAPDAVSPLVRLHSA